MLSYLKCFELWIYQTIPIYTLYNLTILKWLINQNKKKTLKVNTSFTLNQWKKLRKSSKIKFICFIKLVTKNHINKYDY